MSKLSTEKPPVVLYHADCLDGFASALAAYVRHPQATFVPVQYSTEPDLDLAKGRDVFVLDFSYKLLETMKLAESARRLIVIDHHESAERELTRSVKTSYSTENAPHGLLPDNVTLHIDQARSGCVGAWEYFLGDAPVPQLFKHIEDRDLWKFRFMETRAITAALTLEYEDLDHWARKLLCITLYPPAGRRRPIAFDPVTQEAALDRLYEVGKPIVRYRDRLVAKYAEQAHDMELQGHWVKAANVPREFASEVANVLAEGAKFGCAWSVTGHKEPGKQWVRFSLRSKPKLASGEDNEACMNVARIAEFFDGGGHPHAAGFEEVETLEGKVGG